MSFIMECPNCKDERIEKFSKSSFWSDPKNHLCKTCREQYDDHQFELDKELKEAKEYIKKVRSK